MNYCSFLHANHSCLGNRLSHLSFDSLGLLQSYSETLHLINALLAHLAAPAPPFSDGGLNNSL